MALRVSKALNPSVAVSKEYLQGAYTTGLRDFGLVVLQAA